MSVPSGRDRVASEVERLMRRAAFHLAPEPGDVPALVDLLIDVVKAEIRADASPGPTPRPECKPVVGGECLWRCVGCGHLWGEGDWSCDNCGREYARPETTTFFRDKGGVGMKSFRDRIEAGADPILEGPALCGRCGASFERSGPGRWRPTCECWRRDVD
jgi:hypothetical protein